MKQHNIERKFRTPVFKSVNDQVFRKKCPHCGGHQLMRYYEGPIELYCYECSWKTSRVVVPTKQYQSTVDKWLEKLYS